MAKAAIVPALVMNPRHISVNIPKASHNGKRPSVGLAVIAVVLLAGCASPRVKDTSRTFQTVVIDAGHGGLDNGTRSRWGGNEKTAALEVATRLQPKLRAAGFNTVMTRDSDRFIELNERARISNRQSNAIFLSIHFNEAPRRGIRGTEAYYKSPVSRELAQRLLGKVSRLPGASSRGLRTANFRVLRLNEYPAVLLECGYLSNPSEGSRCATSSYRERLAGAIADGLIEQRAQP